MENNVITVTETANKKVPADTAVVTVTVIGEAKTSRDASEKAARTADGIVAALKVAGLKDIRAEGVNVSARREDKKITGYRAVRNYVSEFGFDTELLGKTMEALADAPCEWRVSFKLKDKKAAEGLIEQAVKSARAHAETIAKAAGVKLGAIKKAEYSANSGDYSARPMLMRASFDGCNGAADGVEPEMLSLSETVVCSFEIE